MAVEQLNGFIPFFSQTSNALRHFKQINQGHSGEICEVIDFLLLRFFFVVSGFVSE